MAIIWLGELQLVQPMKQCNGLAIYAGYSEHKATNGQWQLTALDTLSRCVNSCSALYCATAAFTISLPIDGSTRSSQSSPRFCNSTEASQQVTCLAAVKRHSAQQVCTPYRLSTSCPHLAWTAL